MMKYLRCLLLLVSACAAAPVEAQDIHLTQFYTAQQNLNPALIGRHDGAWRIAGNYRNQWREINAPITTGIIAFDKKFFIHSDEISAGILLAHDNYSGYALNTTKVFATVSYMKRLGRNELRAGIQLGGVFRSTDLNGQTFPNQWVYQDGQFDPNLSNQENNLNVSQQFFDMNFGVAWRRKFKKWTPMVGYSIFHINRPDDTYFNEPVERLRVRQLVHMEADVPINSEFVAEPKLLYMWTTMAQDFVMGGNFRFITGKQWVRSIYAGAVYRAAIGTNFDMVSPIIGFNIKGVEIGLNYDVNVSELSSNSQKSTFELSIIYTGPLNAPKALSIPCDRY
jgi:type IX secretion system PorP/SprF family membrane protein